MGIITCARCGNQVHLVDKCNYCDKSVCQTCVKSGRKVKNGKRKVICVSCWSDINKRKKYKMG